MLKTQINTKELSDCSRANHSCVYLSGSSEICTKGVKQTLFEGWRSVDQLQTFIVADSQGFYGLLALYFTFFTYSILGIGHFFYILTFYPEV